VESVVPALKAGKLTNLSAVKQTADKKRRQDKSTRKFKPDWVNTVYRYSHGRPEGAKKLEGLKIGYTLNQQKVWLQQGANGLPRCAACGNRPINSNVLDTIKKHFISETHLLYC
jgi:hypothetical protein